VRKNNSIHTAVALTACFALACGAGERFARAEEVTALRSPEPRSLGDLSGPWQLLVDDYLIAEQSNVVRTYHAFEKHPENPVALVEDWMPGGRGTILPKPDGTGWIRFATARATVGSPDLVHWGERKSARPEAKGSAVSVMHTPWDAGREYKMVTYQHESGSPYSTFHGFHSLDGVSAWTPIEKPLMFARADTLQFGWDAHRRRYFGTMKIWTDVRGVMRRCVGLSTSSKFDSGWSDAQMILIPDTLDDAWTTEPGQRTDFYSFSAFAYETMYLGLVERFRISDGNFAEQLRRDPADGRLEIELLTSRDGERWERIADRKAILPVGPLGSWDGGMIKIPSHPVVDGGRIKLVYSAGFYTHGYGRGGYPTRGEDDDKQTGLGLATLRKDGWASLDAGRREGSVTTCVLRGVAGPLAVNFLTARGRGYGTGWLKVEVLDEQGRVIAGYSRDDSAELRGDHLDQIVTWNGSDALPADRALRFRFLMTDARLYSFRAGDALRAEGRTAELRVVHTFEGGKGAAAGLHFQNEASIVRDPAKAAFGSGSVEFGDGPRQLVFVAGDPRPPREDVRGNGLELDNTFRLGERFTLAAQVNCRGTGVQRLFSSFDPYPERFEQNHPPLDRVGWIGNRELIFDFDPSGAGGAGCLRLVVHGKEVTAPGSFATGEYHHLAATYDDGKVDLYLDGRRIGGGKTPGGAVTMLVNLRVATDSGPFSDRFQGSPPSRQLRGRIDDLLVLGRALSPQEIKTLGRDGAARFWRLLRQPRR
jgi:hypothetical protein